MEVKSMREGARMIGRGCVVVRIGHKTEPN